MEVNKFNVHLKKVYYIFLIFIGIENIYSQSTPLKELENKINVECENCNQANLNIYLYKQCVKLDSITLELSESFKKSLNRKYAKDKDLDFRDKMEKLYSKTLKNLIKTRTDVIKDYLSLNVESAENDYFRYFFYIYWSDRIVELQTYYINTIEEN